MPEATVNGATIHYQRKGDGPPLVLIHGLGSSADDWEHQLPTLAADFDVVVPDLRGHGQSQKTGPYTVVQFSSDVIGLIEELGMEATTIVGISLGGMVGFQMAADHPELVTRLVAVNALQTFETKRISQKLQLAIRKVITRRLSMEKIGEVLSKRLFPDEGMDQQRATMVLRWSRNDKTAYEATFRGILDWAGVKEAMSTTMVPITVIASDMDYVLPADKEPYVAAMPTAMMIVIADAHHGVPMERPERFNELLGRVLADET